MVVIGLLQGTIVMCGALLRPIIIKPSPSDKSSKEQLKSKQEDAKQNLDQEQLHGSVSSGDSGVQSVEDPEVGGQIMEKEEKKALSPKPNDKPGRPKLLDLSVLKEGSFLCYSAFGLFATLGFFAPQLYVVELNVSQGVDRDKAAYSLSIMAIAEILGRLSIGWMMSWRRLRKIYVLLTCVLLLCLVLVLFTLVSGFWPVAVCCMLYGFLLGNVASTHIPMLAEDDVVGIQRMASAAGVYVCIQSFAGLAGPPLGGRHPQLVYVFIQGKQEMVLNRRIHIFSLVFILCCRCVGGHHRQLWLCILLLCCGDGTGSLISWTGTTSKDGQALLEENRPAAAAEECG